MLKKLALRALVFLLARKACYKMNCALLKLAHRGLGVNNFGSSAMSGEDHFLRHILGNYSINTIFDVGAHTGEYCHLVRASGYQGQVFLFEPHPQTFGQLQQNLKSDPKSKAFNLALSDQAGEAMLFDYAESVNDTGSGSQHASLFAGVVQGLRTTEAARGTKIVLSTLDEIVAQEKIERISLLKLDTEGNEMKVLQGAKETLAAGKIDIIQFEFGDSNVVSRVFFKDFFDLLSTHYHLFRLLPDEFLPIESYDAKVQELMAFQNFVAFGKHLDSAKS